MSPWETVWTFHTAQFAVELAVAPEEMAPEDSFENAEDIALANEGGWNWFAARVQVSFVDAANPVRWADIRERTLGENYLGGCSYHGLADFRSDAYFRDMVAEAIGEARGTLARMGAVKMRKGG